MVELCQAAQSGDATARRLAAALDAALAVLSKFDEGPDLVLYYKELLVLTGDRDFELQLNPDDALSPSQRRFVATQLELFLAWWESWPGKNDAGV